MIAARVRTRLARFWALAWGLELCAGAVSPAWAQRRKAEPEANPQFQQEVQGQQAPAGGAPLGPGAAASPVAVPAPSAEPSTETAGAARGASGVQIGSMPTAAAPPPPPVSALETRVTVRVKDAPLATFLDTISAQAKVNFIITEGLTAKRVTAFLQNVTVREALQILLEIKGLTYQQIGRSNTYVVSPRSQTAPNQITRIYTLSYIALIPLLTKAESGAAFGGTGADGGKTPPAGGGQGGAGDAGAADGPIAILNVLRTVLTKNGKVSIEPRNNSLIVTDIPEVFPQVEQIIAELDKKAPQVMIEAQIVEINSDRSQQLGIEWGGPNGELASFTGGFRDTTFPLNLPNNLSHTKIFDPVSNNPLGTVVQGSGGTGSSNSATPAAGAAAGATQGASTQLNLRSGIVDLRQLSVLIRALVTRSEARFLGKPKILTLNNQKAVIQITKNEAVALVTTQQSAQGLASQTAQPQREETGLTLNVTPQVNKEGYVTLLIEPKFSDVQASPLSSLQTPVLDPVTRRASSLLRVKNGQTIVLGGLLQSREEKTVRKVPFLGYIPLIGWLFTSTSVIRRNTDLVIFLTPTLVSD